MPQVRILLGAPICKKSGREDSNLRPPAPKAGALPGCATPRAKRGRDVPQSSPDVQGRGSALAGIATASERLEIGAQRLERAPAVAEAVLLERRQLPGRASRRLEGQEKRGVAETVGSPRGRGGGPLPAAPGREKPSPGRAKRRGAEDPGTG